MKKVFLLFAFVAFSAAWTGAEVIGYDPFDYADGSVAGRNGGFGWDWNNLNQVRTLTLSNWNVSGTQTVTGGEFQTNSSGWGRREYNGPGEGGGSDAAPTDERLGALRGTGVVYYAVTYREVTASTWGGFSGFDFGTERVFFGRLSGQANFGVQVSGGATSLSTIPVVVGQTYRLVGALDFNKQQLLLWVDPDWSDYYNRTTGSHSADAVVAYTGTNWNTAVRLASQAQTRWDDLTVTTTFEEALINPRTLARNPSPAYAGGNAAIRPTLEWSPGADPNSPGQNVQGVVSYNVYLAKAEDPNLPLIATVPAGSPMLTRVQHAVGTDLDYRTAYRWRVDMVMSGGQVVQGLVWRFTTVTDYPVVVGQTGGLSIPRGGSGQLSVTVTCPFPITYQWYQVAAGGDIMLSDSMPGVSDSQTSSLRISDFVPPTDEEFYYCIITNDRQQAAQSANNILAVQRRIAYWSFENDSFQNVEPGLSPASPACVSEGAPLFIEGRVGRGLSFSGANNDIVYMQLGSGSFADILDYGMTVAAWVKTDVLTAWNGYISRDGEGGMGWQIRQRNNQFACFTTRCTSSNVDGQASITPINDNRWHHVAATFDLQAGVKRLYINGRLERTDTVSSPIVRSRGTLALGGRVRDNNNRDGRAKVALDEVEIYNYALSARDIARIYTQVETDVMICLGNPAMDLNGNCRVDLPDLVLLLSHWLECNLVPECKP